MRALILGGNGYLGSLIAHINDGHGYFDEVRVVDKDGSVAGLPQDISLITDDMVPDLVNGVDEIFVLASPVGKDRDHDENAMFDLNFRSIAKILIAAKAGAVVNFFSSGAIFEGYETVLATPDTWPQPQTSYSKYKWLMENFIYRYARAFRVIRLASCYGWSPAFKAHTLINSVLDTYRTGEFMQVRMNRQTGISLTDASYAMGALLELVAHGRAVNETTHICQQFLPVSDVVSAISSQLPVKVEFLDQAKAMGGYSIYTGSSDRDQMMEEIARSAAFFGSKIEEGLASMPRTA